LIGKPSKIDNLRVIQKKIQFIELQWDLENGNSAGQFILQYNTTDGTKIVSNYCLLKLLVELKL